jgi:hypothetical protein
MGLFVREVTFPCSTLRERSVLNSHMQPLTASPEAGSERSSVPRKCVNQSGKIVSSDPEYYPMSRYRIILVGECSCHGDSTRFADIVRLPVGIEFGFQVAERGLDNELRHGLLWLRTFSRLTLASATEFGIVQNLDLPIRWR